MLQWTPGNAPHWGVSFDEDSLYKGLYRKNLLLSTNKICCTIIIIIIIKLFKPNKYRTTYGINVLIENKYWVTAHVQ